MFGPNLSLGLKAQVSAGSAPAPPDLITNGSFGSGADWTLTEVGGGALPTISGGKLNLTAGNEGNIQRATQTLAGGSSPAGTYRVTFDLTGAGNVDFTLLGAANESRGVGAGLPGTGSTIDIVASGEVSQIRLSADNDGTMDNVVLQLVS